MNADFLAFAQVVLVDLVLAGDNAVVIGTLAASLPAAQRRAAVLIGIGVAVVARIAMSLGVLWLLTLPGVMVVGAILLFWVAWKMWKELRAVESAHGAAGSAPQALHRAILTIVLADLSMSLDNVLGVAGAANGHTGALIAGLALSIVLMGAAASAIANVINRHRWIAYAGLALILFVAARMSWHGAEPLLAQLAT